MPNPKLILSFVELANLSLKLKSSEKRMLYLNNLVNAFDELSDTDYQEYQKYEFIEVK